MTSAGRPGRLYVVATPIGNLSDITLRAVDVLRAVDIILCEDTRKTRVLADHLALSATLKRFDAHAEGARIEPTLDLLKGGAELALVSDAGTPTISDPGHRLVAAARDAGIEVTVLPGACSIITALAGSGFDGRAFSFHGFLDVRPAAIARVLGELRPGVHTFFVPARDLAALTSTLANNPAVRRVAVARELTKLHESWYVGSPSEVAAAVVSDPHGQRGEAVVCLEFGAVDVDDDAIRSALERAIGQGLKLKAAAKEVASQLGISTRRAYQLGLRRDEPAKRGQP